MEVERRQGGRQRGTLKAGDLVQLTGRRQVPDRTLGTCGLDLQRVVEIFVSF